MASPPSGSPAAERLAIDLGDRAYEIRLASGDPAGLAPFLREALAACWAGRRARQALVVTDTNVEPIAREVAETIRQAELAVERVSLPPGEATKSLARCAELYDHLARLGADRHTLVVAVGGGVIGDLAGFAAATYARGLPLFMVPTSLLAQVDSSVGGKVGVNLPAGKNLVGAFHQPIGVWIDTAHLDSLPPREFRAGLAEVVKYGMILDAAFLDEIEASVPAIQAGDPATLRRLVLRSCQLKAHVVTQDELEQTGLRAVLNFGHTIGHGLEALAGYEGGLLHGEAVAIGMALETRLAADLGWIDAAVLDRLCALLRRLGLPTAPAGNVDPDALLAAMTRDKKNQGGRIAFVLPRAIGQVERTDEVDQARIRALLPTRPHRT
jgi:3-dehydroquinate synthase